MIQIEKFPFTVFENKNWKFVAECSDVSRVLTVMKTQSSEAPRKRRLYTFKTPPEKIFYEVKGSNIVFDLDDTIVIYSMPITAIDSYDKIVYGEPLKKFIDEYIFSIIHVGSTIRCFRLDVEILYFVNPNILGINHVYVEYDKDKDEDELKFLEIYMVNEVIKVNVPSVMHELENLKNSAEGYLLKKVGRDVLSIIKKYLR